MWGDDMPEKINECYLRLQGLDITPTTHNLEILLQTLYDLKSVYDELKKGGEDGRAAADSQ